MRERERENNIRVRKGLQAPALLPEYGVLNFRNIVGDVPVDEELIEENFCRKIAVFGVHSFDLDLVRNIAGKFEVNGPGSPLSRFIKYSNMNLLQSSEE